jgi:hypothetical protein
VPVAAGLGLTLNPSAATESASPGNLPGRVTPAAATASASASATVCPSARSPRRAYSMRTSYWSPKSRASARMLVTSSARSSELSSVPTLASRRPQVAVHVTSLGSSGKMYRPRSTSRTTAPRPRRFRWRRTKVRARPPRCSHFRAFTCASLLPRLTHEHIGPEAARPRSHCRLASPRQRPSKWIAPR